VKRSQGGMTLVEVMVASVIFAMIMAAVVAAMRTFGQSYERLQLVTDQTSRKREVDRFLRYALEDALLDPGYFDGSSSEVMWVAPIDRAGSAGGLQHLKLEQSGGALLLTFAPFDRFADPQSEPDWGAVIDPIQLLDEVDRLEVSYRATPEDDWSTSLDLDEATGASMPWGIQLSITAQGEVWPPLTVAFQQSGVQR